MLPCCHRCFHCMWCCKHAALLSLVFPLYVVLQACCLAVIGVSIACLVASMLPCCHWCFHCMWCCKHAALLSLVFPLYVVLQACCLAVIGVSIACLVASMLVGCHLLQILVITTYLIASGFMSVYHMAVDTIFICACKLCNVCNVTWPVHGDISFHHPVIPQCPWPSSLQPAVIIRFIIELS